MTEGQQLAERWVNARAICQQSCCALARELAVDDLARQFDEASDQEQERIRQMVEQHARTN